MNVRHPDFIISEYQSGGAFSRDAKPGVRVTHVPTRLAVRCEHTRSEHRNLSICATMMEAALPEEFVSAYQ